MPSDTMREILRDNNMLLMAISRFNIAFGFGEKTIGEVCIENGVDTDTLLAVCNLLSDKRHEGYPIALDCLMDYLKRAHTFFLDCTLPRIRHNLIDAINYSDTDEAAFQLIKFYDDYVEEAKRHMEYENDVIFRYVDRLLRGCAEGGFNISRFSENHSHMASKLRDIKDVFICHYKQKDNARLSGVLFDIVTCEKDFMSHFEVEKCLLIPEIEKLERGVRPGFSDDTAPSGNDQGAPEPDPLSAREKEIVKCVAQGLSNKEIADRLCLSIHTVTTHRRNISSKLCIHSVAGLTVYAFLHHIIEIDEVNPS